MLTGNATVFGNINVTMTNDACDIVRMLAVALNLMAGYFLLAVLVTRLAILFQTMAIPKSRSGFLCDRIDAFLSLAFRTTT